MCFCLVVNLYNFRFTAYIKKIAIEIKLLFDAVFLVPALILEHNINLTGLQPKL